MPEPMIVPTTSALVIQMPISPFGRLLVLPLLLGSHG